MRQTSWQESTHPLGCLMARFTCTLVLTRLSGLTQAWREEAAGVHCGGCSRSWQPYWQGGGPAAAAEGTAGLCQRSRGTTLRLLSALPAAEPSANMLQLLVDAC